jgi:hypothetical protein
MGLPLPRLLPRGNSRDLRCLWVRPGCPAPDRRAFSILCRASSQKVTVECLLANGHLSGGALFVRS